MRIDAFNHFFPKLFRQAARKRPARHRQARDRACRRSMISMCAGKIIDSFPDYKQIISLAAPTLEQVAKGDPAVARRIR